MRRSISEMLAARMPHAEALAMTAAIIGEYTGMGSAAQLAFGDRPAGSDTARRIVAAAARAAAGEPLQYIIGYTTFCGHRIEVTPGVLIPRPETEEMTAMIISDIRERHGWRGSDAGRAAVSDPAGSSGTAGRAAVSDPAGSSGTAGRAAVSDPAGSSGTAGRAAVSDPAGSSGTAGSGSFRGTITDLCTGSGCIAVALSLAFPQATVIAADNSERALAVAGRNISGTGASAGLLSTDILTDSPLLIPPSDLIVSNPPYVTMGEKRDMRRNVLDYEPHEALFVPDENPLLYYRAIAGIADGRLRPGGTLWLEVSENHAGATAALLCDGKYSNVQVIRDFRGKERFIRAQKREGNSTEQQQN